MLNSLCLFIQSYLNCILRGIQKSFPNYAVERLKILTITNTISIIFCLIICTYKRNSYNNANNGINNYLIEGRSWHRSSTSSHEEILIGQAICPNVSRTSASHDEKCVGTALLLVVVDDEDVLLTALLSLCSRSERCRRPRRRGDGAVDVDGFIGIGLTGVFLHDFI